MDVAVDVAVDVAQCALSGYCCVVGVHLPTASETFGQRVGMGRFCGVLGAVCFVLLACTPVWRVRVCVCLEIVGLVRTDLLWNAGRSVKKKVVKKNRCV